MSRYVRSPATLELMEDIGIGVVVTVISAGVIGVLRWLITGEKRAAAKQSVRQHACRHHWELINQPDDSVVLITGDNEWCVKCDARR